MASTQKREADRLWRNFRRAKGFDERKGWAVLIRAHDREWRDAVDMVRLVA